MPVITSSTYSPPRWLHNGHLQTIIPSLLRKVPNVDYIRERISTRDGDFLDLDWLKNGHKRLVVISHGLEGDSQRPYVKGMAKAFSLAAWDVVAWNFRGCSGEINQTLRFYHSGATEDLHAVTEYALSQSPYEQIAYVGFSLGGNLTLKYLGEQSNKLPSSLIGAVVFSVPLHLHSSSQKISHSSNWIYSKRFLKNLKQKVKAKSKLMPEKLTLAHFENIRSLQDFDNFYTAPLHGFQNAIAYYEACSAIYFLPGIETPTLIVNALNDPFLSEQCYPESAVKGHPCVHLEIPKEGGHCGFPKFDRQGIYWSEQRALDFFESL